MKFLIDNRKFSILTVLLASLMIYDDAQFANSLARVVIGFTSGGIEVITILAEFLQSPREKCVVPENIHTPPPPPHMEGQWKFQGGVGANRQKFPRGRGVHMKNFSTGKGNS